MKKLLLIFMFIFLSGCGGENYVNRIPLPSAKSQSVIPRQQVDTLFAILRPDSNGKWYIQTNWGPNPDPDHASNGISWDVEQTDKHVRIHFLKTYTHAGQIQISSDDDFGSTVRGYSNLGLNSATIRIEVNGQRINPWEINRYFPNASQAGNFWIMITMSNKIE